MKAFDFHCCHLKTRFWRATSGTRCAKQQPLATIAVVLVAEPGDSIGSQTGDRTPIEHSSIVTMDADGLVIEFNTAAERTFG